jgi:HEAT repeat protein
MAFIKKSAEPRSTTQDQRAAVRDFDGLIRQLDDADPAARRWAARDLAGYPDASTALLARLQHENEVSVREVILTALMRNADSAAIAGLVTCLRSEDANLRNEAIEAMKSLPIAVAPIMRGLLVDSDPDVRIFAINVLESLRHADVEAWLIEVIEHEPLVNVCGTAVDLLSEVGSPASRDALERLKARFAAEPYIQFAAALALKRIAPVPDGRQ